MTYHRRLKASNCFVLRNGHIRAEAGFVVKKVQLGYDVSMFGFGDLLLDFVAVLKIMNRVIPSQHPAS